MGAKQSSANVTFSKPGASANKSGYIWVAPLGTPIPTDATTELGVAFVGLGYLSEDGLTEPASLTAGDDIVAAGGDTVAQADPTFSKTWTGTCIEALNEDLLKVAYGSTNVTTTPHPLRRVASSSSRSRPETLNIMSSSSTRC